MKLLRYLLLFLVFVAVYPANGQVNRLQPGQLATTVLPEVVQPTLFNGSDGFFLDVPEGAIRVEFQLTTAPPEANVNLYARLAVDVMREADGSITADYRSENPGGQETIVIADAAMGPITPGRYFVAFEAGFRNPQTFAFLTTKLQLSPGETNLDIIESDDFEGGGIFGWTRNYPLPDPQIPGSSTGGEDSDLITRRDDKGTRALQLETAGNDYFVLPTRYVGNIALLGSGARLEFDMRVSTSPRATIPVEVRVLGLLTTYRWNGQTPDSRYQHFNAPFDGEGWQRLSGTATFEDVLQNVLRIEIRGNFGERGTITYIDNVVLLGRAAPPALPALSDFDSGEDGWTHNIPDAPFLIPRFAGVTSGDTRTRVVPFQTAGNPGGYLQATDSDDFSRDYVVAPDKFLGNLGALGTTARIELDRQHFSPSGATRGVEIRIMGFGAAYAWVGPRPTREWMHYVAPLLPANWTRLAGEESFEDTLAAVQRIEVSIDELPGFEESGLDNFEIVVPQVLVPALTATPSTLEFSAVGGGERPAPRAVELTSNGPVLEWIAAPSPGANWIELPQTRGTTPETLIVGVNPAGLPPGVHRGSVDIAFAGSTNEPTRIDVTLTAVSPTAPLISDAGVVNAASFTPNASPGGELTGGMFFAVFGERLADRIEQNSQVPYPSRLASTQVTMGGILCPLVFVSNLQIVGVVPQTLTQDLTPQAVSQGLAFTDVIVTNSGEISPPVQVRLAPVNPVLFSQDQTGGGPGAILNVIAQGPAQLNAFDNPAQPAQAVSIFGTGLGPTQTPVLDGFPATGINTIRGAVRVIIGGVDAQVLFAGLSPEFPHLYQLNAVVPGRSQQGCDVPVQIVVDDVTSNEVTMAITSNSQPCR